MSPTMTKIEQAKARVCLNSVFFPLLIMSTPIDPDDDINTMATDGVSIWYREEYVAQQPVEVVISLLLHEILHIVKRHLPRRGSRDAHLWNVAADFDVNGDLVGAGYPLWPGALHDKQFKGMSVETIYDLLARDADKRPSKGDAAGEDLKDPPPKSPDEQARDEQSVKDRVGQAAVQARLAGQMTDLMERLVGELLVAVIPWEQVLLEFMQTIANTGGEDWGRRSRMALDVFLPAQRSRTMGEVVVVVDTSGSISNDVFRRVMGEVDYIAESVKPSAVRIIWCDSCVRGEQLFERGDDIQLLPKGGGGTDMPVGLAHAAQYDPAVVILFTDCYTPWCAEPDYPLLVLSTTELVAPIGTTIHVKV